MIIDILDKKACFYRWCTQAQKEDGRIVWESLGEREHDAAVVAYIMDRGRNDEVALRLQSETCPTWYKDEAFTQCYRQIVDTIARYNDDNSNLFM